MKLERSIKCPNCDAQRFTAKYETTYVYSYKIDMENNKKLVAKDEPLPFLFDNREQCNPKQYIECDNCGIKYPCEFSMNSKEVDFTILRKAIRADHADEPEYWG